MIIEGRENPRFFGCDKVVQLGEERENTPIRLLQLTDMQIIDSSQQREEGRLREDEAKAWAPGKEEGMCGNQIRSLVAQVRPDLIFLTGDLVYGSFDDKGSGFFYFCELMESFGIPWAPVFGNHDNETKRGVDWQCRMLESCPHCLFCRGSVSGNGNYTVGIAVGEKLVRVLHLLDSNGCSDCTDEKVIRKKGIYPDQVQLVQAHAGQIDRAQGRRIPSLLAYHIPTEEFARYAKEKGYLSEEKYRFHIGVDVKARDGDFGFCSERYRPIPTDEGFSRMLREAHVDGVFVGHHHANNTCISGGGIRWVFGLKTGQYDYHEPGQLGGTLVTLRGEDFEVNHLPALTALFPYPGQAPMFRGYFVE